MPVSLSESRKDWCNGEWDEDSQVTQLCLNLFISGSPGAFIQQRK